jgi:predicted permease
VVAFHEALVGNVRQSMLVLLAAVVVVLATALANLVSLALVRANGRRAEVTMRIAIGASRRHIVQQLTVEALVLAGAGSVFGWLLAIQMAAASVRWAPPSIPRLGEVSLDGTTALLVAVIAVFVTGLLTGAPFAAVTRARAGDVLRAASRGSIGDRLTHRVRNVMVVGEIAAALVLVLATIVLIQSLLQLHGAHPGFNPEGVFQARVSLPSSYRSPEELSRFYERVSERLAATPGVQQIGIISIAPLSGLTATVPFLVEGQPTEARNRSSVNMRAISPGYLPVVGTRLIVGRHFSETDRSTTSPIALVSDALNQRFLDGRAVGRRLLIDDNNVGPRPVEIIGVVENVRQTALDQPASLDVYIPLRQIHQDWVSLLRTNQFWMMKTSLRSDPAALRAAFVTHLRAVDPDAAVSSTGSMRQYIDAWLGPRRFNLGLFATFALTAVLLAVSGLYGLVSYAVSQRAAEIGLRMAIGASQRDVQRMILRQAGVLAVSGALAGVCLAGVGWRFIASAMRDVSLNPLIVAVTAVSLIGVVLLAAWVPARRASRIEPTLALRSG